MNSNSQLSDIERYIINYTNQQNYNNNNTNYCYNNNTIYYNQISSNNSTKPFLNCVTSSYVTNLNGRT